MRIRPLPAGADGARIPASLIIAVDGTFVPAESGSHVRFAEQVAFAQDRWPRVVLYSLADHPTRPWTDEAIALFRRRFSRVELVLDRPGAGLRLATRLRNQLLPLAPGRARALAGLALPRFAPAWARLMEQEPDAPILVNFADTLTVLNGVPLERAIVDTHDVKFVRYARRTGRTCFDMRTLGRLRSELGLLAAARGIIAIAPDERALYRELLPTVPLFYVPTFADMPAAAPANADGAMPAADLLFVGSDHQFNSEGLARFLKENGDLLQRRSLVVAGTVCGHADVRKAAQGLPGVTLAGFVDDLSALYAGAKAVISPVGGTGLKIKVVEALAHGKPVFASAHAREALPAGAEGCVFGLDPRRIDELLGSEPALAAAEKAARRYFDVLRAAGETEALAAFIEAGRPAQDAPATAGPSLRVTA